MNGIQQTYTLSTSHELNQLLAKYHCSCASVCTCDGNLCPKEQVNRQFTQNEQCNCIDLKNSSSQFFMSNKTTNLTYSLDSSSLSKNNFNSSFRYLNMIDPSNQALPVLEEDKGSYSSLKHTPLYSYFFELSLNNLMRFKESNDNQKQKRPEKDKQRLNSNKKEIHSQSKQKNKQNSNSFDDSIKRQKTQRLYHTNAKRKVFTVSKDNKKGFKKGFTNLNLISNSSHPNSLNKKLIEEKQKTFRQLNYLHFDYNNTDGFNSYNERFNYNNSNQYYNNSKAIPNKYQLDPNTKSLIYNNYNLNQNLNYNPSSIGNNDYLEQIGNSNEIKYQQNQHQFNLQYLNHNSMIGNNYNYNSSSNEEEEKIKEIKQERERKFQIEKEQLRERRKLNQDLMRKEMEDELNRSTFRSNRHIENELEEKKKIIKEGDDVVARNGQLSRKLIQKYPSTNSKIEPQIIQSTKSMNKIDNKSDNKAIYNRKGSNMSSLQRPNNIYKINNQSLIKGNNSKDFAFEENRNNIGNTNINNGIFENQKGNLLLSNKDNCQHQSHKQVQINSNQKYSRYDLRQSETRLHKDIKPIENIQNDNHYDYSKEKKQIDLDNDNPQEKSKLINITKLKPPINNDSNSHSDNNSNNERKNNDKGPSIKKSHSLKSNSSNVSQKLLNLRTILDVDSNNIDNEVSFHSCDKLKNDQLSNIEKKIYDWAEKLSSSPEKIKDYKVKQLDFNIKAQNLIDTIRRSTMNSSNELKKFNDNMNKVNISNNGKSSVIPSFIKKHKIIRGKAILQKQKEDYIVYNEFNDCKSKNDNKHYIKSTMPFKYTKAGVYYSKTNKQKLARFNGASSAFADKRQKNNNTSFLNMNTMNEKLIKTKTDSIMPPNPFESVIKAREFFFLED